MTVSKDLYDRIVADRPFKLSADEVNFREGGSEAHCRGCVHYYVRKADGFTVCEIYRPEDDAMIPADGVCDFFSEDGENFPLLKPET